jgi:hypothetical protein
MKTSPAKGAHRRAFALIDLLFLVIFVAALGAVFSSVPERLRERTHITMDLNNLRQILHASALYSNENNDHLAHPTWGGDLSGPDGWAYLTSKNGREIPGAIYNFPGSCANRDINTAQFTNQLAYFKVGQVSQYLLGVETAWCPKDVSTRRTGSGFNSLRGLWIGRAVKVTSYSWNGTIAGVVGKAGQNVPSGKTYKISQFLPNDWQTWEGNDADAFNFNDAAVNPEQFDVFSRRHAGRNTWWRLTSVPRNSPGGAVVGTFGGSAQYVRWSKVWDLTFRKVGYPNELLNGPGYR